MKTPISRDGKLLTTGDVVRRGAGGLITGRITRTDGNHVYVLWENRGRRLEHYQASALYHYRDGRPALAAICMHEWQRRPEPNGRGWNHECRHCGAKIRGLA